MDIAKRLDAAHELMASEGAEVMLVASNELARIDTVFHLTGYRALGESLAVLARGDAPTLIVTPQWETERAEARAAGWTIRGAGRIYSLRAGARGGAGDNAIHSAMIEAKPGGAGILWSALE
jgi:hypothetical protein